MDLLMVVRSKRFIIRRLTYLLQDYATIRSTDDSLDSLSTTRVVVVSVLLSKVVIGVRLGVARDADDLIGLTAHGNRAGAGW